MEPDGPGVRPESPEARTQVAAVPARWSRAGCIATFVVPFVVFSLTGALVARAIGLRTSIPDISARELLLRTVIVDVPLILGTLLLAWLFMRARPVELGLRALRPSDIRYGLIFGGGLFLASIAIGLVQSAIFGKEQQQIARALLSHHGPVDIALDLLAVSVITPVAEELLFRGVLFGGLRQRLSFVPAAAISALLFMAAHEPQAYPGVFFLGFALALAYERTRGLWAPMVTHGVVNGLPLLLLGLGV